MVDWLDFEAVSSHMIFEPIRCENVLYTMVDWLDWEGDSIIVNTYIPF